MMVSGLFRSMTESASLWTLFASSFLAATLLPGGSEMVLFGVLKLHPQQLWPALVVVWVLGLLLAANLNATPILAAEGDSGCAVKRQVLQEKIDALYVRWSELGERAGG